MKTQLNCKVQMLLTMLALMNVSGLRAGEALVQEPANALPSGNAMTRPLPAGTPQKYGFDPARLQKMNQVAQQAIDSQDYLGAITVVARHGVVQDLWTGGYEDLARTKPMRRDAIFRIYHMTMTVTAAAVMQLVEDGAIRLDDPVEQYLPAFRKMTVFDAGSERPAKRPITIHQLLTHTSGLIYPTPADAIGQRYMDAKIWDAKDLDAFCAQMATLPLSFDPGERWRYGVSYDVLGALVEKVSGKPFETFLQERLFEPLGMLDTGFVVPEAKRTRVVDCSARRAPLIAPNAGEYHGGKGERITAIASGGLGLYSTVDDYLRFAQMLLNGGELDGRRVLGRKTVELMMRNHLNRLDPPTMSSDHREGFGLGGSVRLNAMSSGSLGSDGSFGWSGYASTFYTIDPSEDMIVMLFLQHVPMDPRGLHEKVFNLAFCALVDEPGMGEASSSVRRSTSKAAAGSADRGGATGTGK